MAQGLDNLDFNIGVNVTGLPQLQQVQTRMARLNNTIQDSTKQYSRNSVALNRFAKGALQQAGYQVGDYAVQVANGTSAMQAFGQQGSQMLGIFGPVGAVLGAAVAIFSAIAVAAEKSGQEVQNFSSAFGVLADPIIAVAGTVKDFTQSFKGSMDVVINNIDTALIAVGLFGAYMGVKYVASLAVATASTVTFESAMYSLGVAVGRVKMMLMSFLPFAIFAGMAKLIEMFLQLVKGAGGFGEAIALLKDVTRAVFSEMGILGDALKDTLKGVAWGIAAGFTGAFKWISEQWDNLVNAITTGPFNAIMEAVGSDLRLGDYSSSVTEALSGAQSALEQWSTEAFSSAATSLNSMTETKDALEALRQAYLNGAVDVSIFGDAAADALDKAGNAAKGTLDLFGDMFDDLDKIVEQLSGVIENSMTDAFMSVIDNTKSTADAFRSMARSIIAELYKVLVVQQMVGSVEKGTGIAGFIGKALGMRASGGQITSGQPYIVGEKGPELIVPSRNAHVVPNNQLGNGGGIVINQNVSFGSGVTRAEVQSMLPKMVEATKAAVLDAKRRGGAYGGAF